MKNLFLILLLNSGFITTAIAAQTTICSEVGSQTVCSTVGSP